MKKNFKYYVLGWFVLLGLFNLLAFIIPAYPTLEKFTPSFWIGWGVTIGAFIGQLICASVAFNEESAKKTFYNVSLFRVSYIGLISTFVVALICIVVTPLPYWIAAIACGVVLVINVFALVKAKIAVDAVVAVDEKVETKTAFIYDMREKSESLLAMAKSDEVKAICKKVRDAFKYSDPLSNEGLATIETNIKERYLFFVKAITENNIEVIMTESDELLTLISERNNKCKRLK